MATAIYTKYLGPTTHRGSRVKAWVARSKDYPQAKVTLEWNPELDSLGNHQLAMRKLALSLGWQGDWVAGDCDRTYVWVRISYPFITPVK